MIAASPRSGGACQLYAELSVGARLRRARIIHRFPHLSRPIEVPYTGPCWRLPMPKTLWFDRASDHRCASRFARHRPDGLSFPVETSSVSLPISAGSPARCRAATTPRECRISFAATAVERPRRKLYNPAPPMMIRMCLRGRLNSAARLRSPGRPDALSAQPT